jgi:hypothetical protein
VPVAELSIKDTAAATRIAVRLAPSVTNSIIDGLARQLGFPPLAASNKTRKIQILLTELLADGRSRITASKAIASLTMGAHHRTVAGQAEMTIEDVDAVVTEMRSIGIPTGDLARAGWRDGLKRGSQPTPIAVTAPRDTAPAAPQGGARGGPRPTRHDDALTYLAQLVAGSIRPQQRGYELEKILFGVLQKEDLEPLPNIVNPGEQIDLAFVLGGQHYLVECKWEADPVGLPVVAAFGAKVSRKAEGTFGVLVSMSGFVQNLNETAARGARLNCVGLANHQLISVLEGRTTFAALVRTARASASTRALFC